MIKKIIILTILSVSIIGCQSGNKRANSVEDRILAILDSVRIENNDSLVRVLLSTPDYLDQLIENANQGNTDAQYVLATCYYQLKKYDKAVYYLQLAAEQGDGESQKMLGDCYYYGIGVEEDEACAKKWYDRAKEQGVDVYSTGTDISLEEIEDDIYSEEPSHKPSIISYSVVGGKYRINCQVNGTSMYFILNPNSSAITMSRQMATLMFKKGFFLKEDVDGDSKFVDSKGSVREGTIFKLRELKFSDILLRYERVKVISSQTEPLVVGQKVIEELGNIEFNNKSKVMILKYHSDY